MDAALEKTIIDELQAIHDELSYIRNHMIDIDSILTSEETVILEEGLEELERGETVPFSELKAERG